MSGLGHGFKVGHWTDPETRSGCTVVLPPLPNEAAFDVRGASPSTRELEHLRLERKITEIHGLVLTGGSAFGLAVADGVMGWLEEHGVGYATPVGVIPIVPAAVIFDLSVALRDARPGPEQGRLACEAATADGIPTGRVGAGAGATVGKWAGREYAVPGGVGIGRADAHGTSVSALAVVNAVGDVLADDGSVLAGSTNPDPASPTFTWTGPARGQNTVLALVCCQGSLSSPDLAFLAARGSDGVTKTIRPAHTRYDGDICFAIANKATAAAEPDLDVMGQLATQAVAAAVRSAVT